jgi:capsid assembly protease
MIPKRPMGLPASGLWALDSRYLDAVRTTARQLRGNPDDIPRLRQSLRAPKTIPTLPQLSAVKPSTIGAGAGRGKDVACIMLTGILENCQSLMGYFMGGTDLHEFRNCFATAMNNPSIGSILLFVDSPGGSVGGVQEAADMVFAARGKKRVTAMVDGMACSAAYWITSQAAEVVMSPSAEVGSVGVYQLSLHYDRALDQQGVTPEIIHEPPMKIAGNPFQPLADEARSEFQKQVHATYVDFLGAVARGRSTTRGAVSASYGRGMTVMARPALDAKMVDRIDPIETVIAGMVGSARTAQAAWDMRRQAHGQRVRDRLGLERGIDQMKFGRRRG